jgi:hypothetical protein
MLVDTMFHHPLKYCAFHIFFMNCSATSIGELDNKKAELQKTITELQQHLEIQENNAIISIYKSNKRRLFLQMTLNSSELVFACVSVLWSIVDKSIVIKIVINERTYVLRYTITCLGYCDDISITYRFDLPD